MEFTKIYLISNEGSNIYHDVPQRLIPVLENYGLQCSKTRSVPEFAVDVARGKFGDLIFINLEKEMFGVSQDHISSIGEAYEISDVVDQSKYSRSFMTQVALTAKRTFMFWNIKTPLLLSNVVFNAMMGTLAVCMFEKSIGAEDGCMTLNEKLTGRELREYFGSRVDMFRNNMVSIIGALIHLSLACQVATGLTFPIEFNVVRREISNSWYSVTAYFIGKTLADLPGIFAHVTVMLCITYFGNGYEGDVWRLCAYVGSALSVAFVAEAIGITVAIMSTDIFVTTQYNSLFLAPTILLSGFFIPHFSLPLVFKKLSNLSYIRYAFENMVISLFGFGRCTTNSTAIDLYQEIANLYNPMTVIDQAIESISNQTDFDSISSFLDVDVHKLTDVLISADNTFKQSTNVSESDQTLTSMSPSFILNHFHLSDSDMMRNFIYLGLMYFIAKLIALVVLMRKCKSQA